MGAGACVSGMMARDHGLRGHAPLASDPLASDPLASDPLASDPLASDPLASDPLASDPLTPGRAVARSGTGTWVGFDGVDGSSDPAAGAVGGAADMADRDVAG
jgi:hypothetical protein